MAITEQSAITWSARPGERAHAFPATSTGWLRGRCGIRWTVLFSEQGPVRRCGECLRALALDERDRRQAAALLADRAPGEFTEDYGK